MINPAVRQRVRLFALFIALMLTLKGPSLRCEPLVLNQQGCGDLSMETVSELIALELGHADHRQPDRITFVCSGDALEIVVWFVKPVSRLNRTIVLNESRLKERIVALTVSQLVVAETVSIKKTARAVAPEPVSSVLSSSASSPPEMTMPGFGNRVSITVGGGVKPHGLFSMVTGYALLRGDIGLTRAWGIAAVLSFEGGQDDRDIGGVRIMSGLVGIGAVWRMVAYHHLRGELMASASIGYTHLKGDAVEERVGSAGVGGVAGEFAAGPAIAVVAKRVLVAVDILVGYTVENPVGVVDSDRSVSLGGPWIGGGLRIGFNKE